MPDEPATLRLWPDPAAAADARRFVRERCSILGADLCECACLLTSELVTNAIRYGRTMITVAVAVDADGGQVSVAVRDDNPESIPAIPALPDLDAEAGRGLAIVNAIAGACGVSRGDTGKSVWFRLP